jgi:hypothetical protein
VAVGTMPASRLPWGGYGYFPTEGITLAMNRGKIIRSEEAEKAISELQTTTERQRSSGAPSCLLISPGSHQGYCAAG